MTSVTRRASDIAQATDEEEIIWPRQRQVWVDQEEGICFVASRTGQRGQIIHWVAMESPLEPSFGEMPLQEWMNTMRFVQEDMDEWFDAL